MKLKDKKLLRDFKQVITALVPDATILLYGSRARGNPAPQSDYDLIILTEQQVPPEIATRLQDAIYDFELDRQAVLSVLFYLRGEWDAPRTLAMPFRRRVEEEAVLL